MAYTSNDKQEVVSVIDLGRGNQIRITTVKDKDNVLKAIDIRNYYTTDSGELSPTKKGVRIKECDLAQVIGVLLMNAGYETIIDINSNFDVTIDLDDDSEVDKIEATDECNEEEIDDGFEDDDSEYVGNEY